MQFPWSDVLSRQITFTLYSVRIETKNLFSVSIWSKEMAERAEMEKASWIAQMQIWPPKN